MIQPGLSRISKLLATTDLPWRAIHVAGTNGKGSICNYIASMLNVYNTSRERQLTGDYKLKYGKFTSPHLVDRWDGISIHGTDRGDSVVSQRAFRAIEDKVVQRNRAGAINASEFEILTATAFELFNCHNVEVGIVEVGMGGNLDATNILGQPTDGNDTPVRAAPLVTAISKIGLDHQAFLGSTLSEIAAQKAGIMKPSVPVVYDESNEQEVRDVLDHYASSVGVKPATLTDVLGHYERVWPHIPPSKRSELRKKRNAKPVHAHIQHNTSVALRSTWLALAQLGRLKNPSQGKLNHFNMLRTMAAQMSRVSEANITPNHGRLERVIKESTTSDRFMTHKLLLDGAHNAQSAAALAEEIALLRREKNGNDTIRWVIGMSNGRDPKDLLPLLLKPGDEVSAVEFGPVDGMPWVQPVPAQQVATVAAELVEAQNAVTIHGKDVRAAMRQALRTDDGRWTVVAGSLYLVGDVHRLLREKDDF